MPASVYINETNGTLASPVETVDPANLNMGSIAASNMVPSAYPVVAKLDGHAFEKWIHFYLSDLGGSIIVDNFKVWLSSLGGGWRTGEGMSTNARTSAYVATTYPVAGAVDTDSSVATQVMPETEPSGANIGIAGTLAGQMTSAPAYSDYLVIQLDVSALTPAGAVNQKTLTFQWDEQ